MMLTAFKCQRRFAVMKRALKFEEFGDISDLQHSSAKAVVEGVLTKLSPMKKAKSGGDYFDGNLSDKSGNVRVYGHVAGVREKLAKYAGSSDPVLLRNCEVKPTRDGDGYEVLVKGYTEVESSPKKLKVDECCKVTVKPVEILKVKEIKGKPAFYEVSAAVKVRECGDVEIIREKKKQDVEVADDSGVIRVTLWEGDVGKVEVGESYEFRRMRVREYRGRKFISTSKDDDHEIQKIDDIGDICDEAEDEEQHVITQREKTHRLKDCSVAGVLSLEKFKGCIKCAAKIREDDCDGLGECVKCGMLQQLKFGCEQWACQMVLVSGSTTVTLRGFGDVVRSIAQQDDVDVRKLLQAAPFDITYSDGNVIESVKRV